ncbi:MAG: NAD(P)H-dependent oxidoreductase [Pseudomonadota bacterium]
MTPSTRTAVLRIDASARHAGSVSRDLSDKIIARIEDADVTIRDLAASALPQVDAAWIEANFTAESDRSAAQKATLAQSDALVAELKAADIVVIGLPIYNFGVPAALKAWIDLVARAGVTFAYSAEGPKGLLQGKRAIVAVASGGTEAGSEIDFATGYLRHFLGFLGITDVDFVAADRLMIDPEQTLTAAAAQVTALDFAAQPAA